MYKKVEALSVPDMVQLLSELPPEAPAAYFNDDDFLLSQSRASSLFDTILKSNMCVINS